MKKVQDTHLNIGGLNWPVLIGVPAGAERWCSKCSV